MLAGALVALLNFPVAGHRKGWLSALALADAGLALTLTTAFVVWQFHARAPLLAVRLLKNRGFGAALLVAVAYGLELFGTTYLVPVFVQDIAAYGPAKAGNLLLVPGFALALALRSAAG